MSILTCGIINKNVLYILIGGIGKVFAELVYRLPNEIENHPFYLGLASGLGMMLSFIPLIITKIKSKSIQEKEKDIDTKERLQSQGAINYAPSDQPQKIKKKRKIQYQKYLLILLTGFLDFAQKILSYIFIESVIYNFWIFDMIFLNLFSYLILKSKLYRHQLLTLGLMIFLGVAINFIAEFDAKTHQNYADSPIKNVSYKNLLLVLTIELIFSLSVVINKYLMEYKFCTPYEISFFQGLFIAIANSILIGIFTNIEMEKSEKKDYIKYNDKYYLDNFFQYNSKLDFREIFVFIAVMICRLTFNLFSIISVKHYTPPHIALILLIGEITFIFKPSMDFFFFAKIIIILIIAFLLLVFTEMIELNFCGLSHYTKRNIAERADKSSRLSDDSNEVDGLEIHSSGSNGSDEKKENEKSNIKDINAVNLKPNQEIEFGVY